ncbi:NAD(P)H-dependent oxidoreductase [Prosthecomicrobium pneumaticum]|uniref:Putative NADPH-quinone reductase n=1 Tax=Prosthecomicrobium pneumaticum TaxID=81895 RepID=A0A7W9CU48_9HYPH|nr:NAD(P)H-dependent oxidoreductase [Prosthecomicrobium pneumaticum]MBB5751699.1 putative NADPH-quinone reductase [Prosthecomicrobium pneumaticum]
MPKTASTLPARPAAASASAAKSVLVVQGHPDPAGGHLCHALADAYAAAAEEAGHRVDRIEVAALDFPLLRTKEAFEHSPLLEALVPAHEKILAADHIVIVFPLWLGTMPALFKAFLEQIMRPGVAFAYRDKALPKKLFSGRTARIVVTMGMPAALYRFFYMAHGVRGLERNILRFVGIAPVRTTLLGMVEGASRGRVEGWLAAMRRLGAAAR